MPSTQKRHDREGTALSRSGSGGWWGAVAVAVIGSATLVLSRAPGPTGQVAWTGFGSADVHSLAFVGGDPQHLLFGHHGGL